MIIAGRTVLMPISSHSVALNEVLFTSYIDTCFFSIGMWCPPAWNRNVQQEFLDKRIGGALRFDMAEFTDKSSPTPLMILPQQLFEEKVGKVEY